MPRVECTREWVVSEGEKVYSGDRAAGDRELRVETEHTSGRDRCSEWSACASEFATKYGGESLEKDG